MASDCLSSFIRRFNEDAAHRDLYGAAGMDVAAVEDWPLAVEVLCPEGRSVPEGWECPNSCKPGDCKDCPGRE